MYANIKPLSHPLADPSWVQVKGKKPVEVKKVKRDFHGEFGGLAVGEDGSRTPNAELGSKHDETADSKGYGSGEDDKSALEPSA